MSDINDYDYLQSSYEDMFDYTPSYAEIIEDEIEEINQFNQLLTL